MASVNAMVVTRLAVTAAGTAVLQANASAQGTGFVGTFLNSFGLTMATELGDKTFFIAAILATQHNLLVVYLGCFGALAFMTVVSSVIGALGATILGTLIPRKYTQMISIALLVYFGLSMVFESLNKIIAEDSDDEMEGERQEAEEQLQEVFFGREPEEEEDSRAGEEMEDMDDEEEDAATLVKLPYGFELELGPAIKVLRDASRELRRSWRYIRRKVNEQVNNVLDRLDTEDVALLWQIFTMVTLAEFGDKSQLATIAMASSSSFFGVAMGGFVGHALCSAIAVSGGFMLSDQVSGAQIDFVGGLLFLGFAAHSFINIGQD